MPENKNALTEVVFYILLSLYSPLHGYGIMQNVKEISGGRVDLGPGTLYGAINTTVSKGWIQPMEGEKNSRKKEYQITDTGKLIVQNEISRLEELVSNGKKILGEDKR
ncbi:MAG: helix-turn-helix transcriptional regulator [Eubacteriales bacterium]